MASLRHVSTGDIILEKRSPHIASNLARLRVVEKSIPSYKLSSSIGTLVELDRTRLALSALVRSRLFVLLLDKISTLCLLLNSFARCSTILVSKSLPPRFESPAVAFTSKIPSSIVRSVTSCVPPPQSKIRTFRSPDFLRSSP